MHYESCVRCLEVTGENYGVEVGREQRGAKESIKLRHLQLHCLDGIWVTIFFFNVGM